MKLVPWVLRKDGSIDTAKTVEAAQRGGRLLLSQMVLHHRSGVPSPSERGACARRRARARANLAWIFNFRKCHCEFYTGQNLLGKCHNCGGRV